MWMIVINTSKIKNSESRERTQASLVTQFGPILTYFGGESSSPFHYNFRVTFQKIPKGYKNESSNIILSKVLNLFP